MVNEPTHTGPAPQHDDWDVTYHRMNCTAWFGKMPHTFTKEILHTMVSQVGEVRSIDFREARILPSGSPSTTFAFVHLRFPHHVDACIVQFVSSWTSHYIPAY